MKNSTLVLNADEIEDYLLEVFPQLYADGEQQYFVEEVVPYSARIRLHYHDRHLRPGGTFSGPSIMSLGDVTVWIMVLAHLGRVESAVTTSLNVNFLHRPNKVDLIAEGKLLKLGRRLAIGEVTIFSDGLDVPVAHITATYSIPPK
jgi:uncharacterized protein (TIGR00369 family)